MRERPPEPIPTPPNGARDRLPKLDGTYPLDTGAAPRLTADGHLTLRSVLGDDEVAAYARAVRRAIARTEPLLPTSAEGEVYRRAFAQHTNLWRVDPGVAQLVRSPRLGALAARLLDVERVRLYHDQALFKAPGGGHTPWHQDMAYWPLETDRTLTMWLPIVGVTAPMGELRFARGSHLAGDLLGDVPISTAADTRAEALLVERGFELDSTGELRAGDASFHLGWTLHAATANTTDRAREVMTVIWFADGTRVSEPRNDGQANDLATWLPGLRPGDLAASELNPLV
jgi:ectoine hydroxylase-related dioxygenase (phytanoyl-CoA dioxygenase family)